MLHAFHGMAAGLVGCERGAQNVLPERSKLRNKAATCSCVAWWCMWQTRHLVRVLMRRGCLLSSSHLVSRMPVSVALPGRVNDKMVFCNMGSWLSD